MSKKQSTNFIIHIVGVAIIVLLIVWSVQMVSDNPLSDINPLELRLDAFEEIDPGLISHEPSAIIDVNRSFLSGVTTDSDNNIYVTAENSVLKYNAAGELLFSFSTDGTARCISVFGGMIYLGYKTRLVRTDQHGLNKFQVIQLDSLSVITSMAVTQSKFYLADAGHRVVRILNSDGSEIDILGERELEKGINGFAVPSPFFDLALDYEGLLWVVNPGMHFLQQYSHTGEMLISWGETSADVHGFCGCCNPIHFAFLSDGRYVTSEKGLVRVKIYDQTGKFQSVVSGPDNFSRGVTGLDIAVDENNRILVLDPDEGKVLIFSEKRNS